MAQPKRDDSTTDTMAAYRTQREKVYRQSSHAAELQKVGQMIISYCGTGKGKPHANALKTLVNVQLKDDTNITNLAASLRDAGWSAIMEFLEAAQPKQDYQSGKDADKTFAEWEQDREVCGLLRNALAIGADPAKLEQVRRAIKKLEAE